MRCRLLLLPLLVLTLPVAAIRAGDLPETIDIREIAARPVAPEYAFARFFETRPLQQPAFSANDRQLYFLRSSGQADNVFAIDLADRSLHQITRSPESVSGYLVARGGEFLVLTRDTRGNGRYDLYRFDLSSGETRQLTFATVGDATMACGLSPDDTLLYYAQTRDRRSESDLWQVEVATGTKRRLLAGNGRTLDCDAVSPDGRYLLYGVKRGFDERRLDLLDLVSGKTRVIAAGEGVNNLDGSFAGDGIYYCSALDADGFHLWHYRIGAAAPEPVRLPFANDLESIVIYGNGAVVVLGYRSGLTGHTAVFPADLSAPLQLGFPSEQVQDAVFSDSNPQLGVIAVETAGQPLRYYLIGKGSPRLLYDANRSGIDSRNFSESRSGWVTGFDGLKIAVHLFIPNGTSARRPRPVILFIHGGPEAHVDPGYISEIQFLNNRGFIVVVPNVRGSTGFGKAYESLDNNDWGGGHIRDLVAVVEAVRKLDFVDAGNVFAAGMSFGGFSVMSLVTQYPDLVRAGADFFGFTELATFVDSWPHYLQQNISDELGFDPRREPQRNRAVSPLYHLDRVSIPLQIHQGANDSRVPREQSDRVVQRLRGSGRTVEYFVYADEGHGFTRFGNQRLAYLRLVDFFSRQLTPASASRSRHPSDPGLLPAN
jgi:dipeptidyl aminopeptidase/acylaminoacyl peptidase